MMFLRRCWWKEMNPMKSSSLCLHHRIRLRQCLARLVCSGKQSGIQVAKEEEELEGEVVEVEEGE